MKYALALIAVAGIAASASAQTSQLIYEASVAGGPFTTGPHTASPGDSVVIRVRCQLLGSTSLLGLAGFNFNPTLTNWTAADSVAAFDPSFGLDDGGNYPVGGPGTADPGNGRRAPFASASATSLPTAINLAGPTLTINGSNANRVAIGQLNRNSSVDLNGDSFFYGLRAGVGNPGTPADYQLPVVFQYKITLSASNVGRTLTASDAGGFTTTSWYTNGTGGASNVTLAGRSTADITILVPTPGALALLGLGGVVAGRRRR